MSYEIKNDIYYDIKEISVKLNVDEYKIEQLMLDGLIERYDFISFELNVPPEECIRNIRLIKLLNKLAADKVKLLIFNNTIKSSNEKKLWAKIINTDNVFSEYLAFYGLKLENVLIVIPDDEVNRFYKILIRKQRKNESKNSIIIDILKRSVSKFYKINGKLPRYSEVLKDIHSEALNDGPVGFVVEKAGREGILLSDGSRIDVKTVKNWLTPIRSDVRKLNLPR